MNMKKASRNLISSALVLLFIFFALPAYSLGETVDLSHVRQNESGQGYRWDNINDILYLTDTDITTESDFGIKLPAGATVSIEGDCRVSAKRYAISCLGSVTFKGTGKLTVSGGECGMYFYSTNRDHKILFLGGEYSVKGGAQAIRSDGAEVSFCGGEISLDGADAVLGCDITASGCEVNAIGAIRASHLLSVDGAKISAFDENEAALSSGGRIVLENVKIEAGGDERSPAAADTYDGQSAVRLTSTYRRQRSSVLFGEGTPGFVDTVVFIAAGVGVAAALSVPFVLKARRRKKLLEKLETVSRK